MPGAVEEFLRIHENLYVDLSWTLVDRIAARGCPEPRWVGVVEGYPDRFVIGSDAVGPEMQVGPLIERIHPFLDALSSSVQELVAESNALRLWFDR
ncbi:MAG: hypothetical protein M0Z87_10610 [Actinomycetota bacterium]|nr:hypothetical protein [Actinomycetota bacterium]